LPGLRVTQFDLPPVLAVARELAQGNPRISFVPGDYHHDPLPGGAPGGRVLPNGALGDRALPNGALGDRALPFDTVLYCGALHQETPESAAALFKKIRASLAPNGRAVIVDLMTDATSTNPVFARLFSINMMLTNEGGRVFTLDETETLLRGAGFTQTTSRLLDIPYGVVVARS